MHSITDRLTRIQKRFQEERHGRSARRPGLHLQQNLAILVETINGRALRNGLIATGILLTLVLVGSRNLGDFDPALIAYLFACIFTTFGVTYRYSVWLQRPPTRKYWERSLQLMREGHTLEHLKEVGRHVGRNFLGQKFIRNRGKVRGYGHMLMAWGCMIAFAITFPLVYG